MNTRDDFAVKRDATPQSRDEECPCHKSVNRPDNVFGITRLPRPKYRLVPVAHEDPRTEQNHCRVERHQMSERGRRFRLSGVLTHVKGTGGNSPLCSTHSRDGKKGGRQLQRLP